MGLVVSGVMNKNVVAANACMSLEELGSLFVEHRFSGFPVVDDEALVGVVTKSDLVKALYPQYDITKATYSDGDMSRVMANSLGNVALKTSVGDVMTRDVITVEPRDYLSDAAELMYEHDTHRVFVVKDNCRERRRNRRCDFLTSGNGRGIVQLCRDHRILLVPSTRA